VNDETYFPSDDELATEADQIEAERAWREATDEAADWHAHLADMAATAAEFDDMGDL
jgi:hypothetical protein